MNIKDHILEIFGYFSTDEELLRLLYYPSDHLYDDPLSPDKGDILSRDDSWNIIGDRLKFTANTDGFDDFAKCRICFYAGDRLNTSNKYSKEQEVIFDILVHRSYQENSLRLYSLMEKVDDILRNNKFTSFGEIQELNGNPINVAENYFGYRLPYLFGELDVK